MPRGKKNLTLDEQLAKISTEIENMEISLKEMKCSARCFVCVCWVCRSSCKVSCLSESHRIIAPKIIKTISGSNTKALIMSLL